MQSSSDIITTNVPTQLLQAGCTSCHPTNSVRALKEEHITFHRLANPRLTRGSSFFVVTTVGSWLPWGSVAEPLCQSSDTSSIPCFIRTAANFACCRVSTDPGHAPVSAAMHDMLQWLSFPQRVTFKLCLLTYKCLHGLAPDYLSRFCTLLTSVPGRPLLRSADANKLLVPRSCTASFGLCSFSSGPTASNDMPAHLRNVDLSLSDFRQLL